MLLHVFLCLLNLSMAIINYEKGNYKNAMASMFVVGVGTAIVINNC